MPEATSSWSRRAFLKTGTALAGASLSATLAESREPTAESIPSRGRAKHCIFLFLTGGPSQLDTFDPKPAARSDIRGPFQPIATRVPGIQLSELLPRTAEIADRWAVVRSVHHREAPIHETGQQLLQTGRLCTDAIEHPHFGSVLAKLQGPRHAGVPAFVLTPGQIGNTGVALSHGQEAGVLGKDFEPVVHSRPAGSTTFNHQTQHARQLVEAGVRTVVVNMFDTVYDRVTWDCHGNRHQLFSTLGDYRRSVCPSFDQAYAGLLQDLNDRGLLEETLVVAAGEFGRTPMLNDAGGRDHWPGVWSILLAGGGVRGGQVVGSSDSQGAEPRDRPVECADVLATIYHAMGVDPTPLVDGRPILEMF